MATTDTITTPLYLAYLAARETLGQARAAREALDADDAIAGDDPRYYAACAAEDAADVALDAARAAYRASDEPREWHLSEDGNTYQTMIGTRAEAIAVAEEAGETGDYDTSEGTVWTDIYIACEDTDEHERITVTIDPDEPDCLDGEDHDWQAPIELVGGIRENPGVWGHGGGVIIHEACLRCGCRRTTDTWAQRMDTGEQGLTAVSYEPEHYDLTGDLMGYAPMETQAGYAVRRSGGDYAEFVDSDARDEALYGLRAETTRESDYLWHDAE